MNIIEKWRQMTKCKDCCNGQPGSIGLVYCGLIPKDIAFPSHQTSRCDSGLWLFRWKHIGLTGGPYAILLDLKDWVGINTGLRSDVYTLIPREDWPEADHA